MFLQRLIELLNTPIFVGRKTAPSLPATIEKAQNDYSAVQTELDLLTRLLSLAKEEKRKALLEGRQTIEAAVTADKLAIEAERTAHQQRLEQLEATYQYRRDALLALLKKLAEDQKATVTTAIDEFSGKVSDAESRAKAAQRELDRIQSQLGNAGQQ